MDEALIERTQDVSPLTTPFVSVDLLKEGGGPLAASSCCECPGDEAVTEDDAGIWRDSRRGKGMYHAAGERNEERVSNEEAVPAGLVFGLHARCAEHFEPELLLGFGLCQVASGELVVDVAKAIVRWLKDLEGVRGYPGFADWLDVEDRKKLAEQLLGVERPEGIEAVLRDGAGSVIIVPDVPDPAVGENAGPALVGMIIEGKTASLVLEFAEQVSFELLEGRFVVVACLGTVGVSGEAVGFGFDDDSAAREIEIGISAGCLVGDAVIYLEGVEKPADILADIVFMTIPGRIKEALCPGELFLGCWGHAVIGYGGDLSV